MENNQTLVERLRAYAENGPFTLIDFLEVATGSKTDSYKAVAEKFADQIEAETLPRPRFSNGEIVDIGDEIIYDARPFEVIEIAVNNKYYGVDNCVKAMTLELLNRFEKVIEKEGASDDV